MLKIIKNPRAYVDLHEMWSYIAINNEERADALYETFEQKFRMLAECPFMGRLRHELEKNLRSFPAGNYIIFYRIRKNALEIVRVLHGKRDLEEIFGLDDEP